MIGDCNSQRLPSKDNSGVVEKALRDSFSKSTARARGENAAPCKLDSKEMRQVMTNLHARVRYPSLLNKLEIRELVSDDKNELNRRYQLASVSCRREDILSDDTIIKILEANDLRTVVLPSKISFWKPR